MNLGPYIIIDRAVGDRDQYCRCTLTGEKFLAHIDGDDLLLFQKRTPTPDHPDACPFLRSDDRERWICTIYRTRPEHCRRFECKKE